MTTINGITSDDVKARLKQINEDTPILWTTSLIKEPQELTVRTAVRNNIMLEKILDNQQKLMLNQNLLIAKIGGGKVGNNLDVQG